jgi:hypothetical protein
MAGKEFFSAESVLSPMSMRCLCQDMGGSWKLSEDNLPHAFDYELYHAPCGELWVGPFRAEVWGLHFGFRR